MVPWEAKMSMDDWLVVVGYWLNGVKPSQDASGK